MRQCQIEISRDFLEDLQKGGKKKDSCFATGAQPDLKKYTDTVISNGAFFQFTGRRDREEKLFKSMLNS